MAGDVPDDHKCYFYSPGLPFRVRERKKMIEVGITSNATGNKFIFLHEEFLMNSWVRRCVCENECLGVCLTPIILIW